MLVVFVFGFRQSVTCSMAGWQRSAQHKCVPPPPPMFGVAKRFVQLNIVNCGVRTSSENVPGGDERENSNTDGFGFLYTQHFHAQIKKFCIFLLLYLYFGFFLFLACLLLDCLSVGFCEILTTRGDREQEERAPHQKRRNKLIKVLSVQFGSTSGYVGSFALSFSPRHRKK